MSAVPKLIVFDLDYTLWNFWVDTHVDPPFSRDSHGKIRDKNNHHVTCYADVPEILSSLHSQGVSLGVASRTSAREEALSLIRLFNWTNFFADMQIYPGDKQTHFKKLHERTKIPFSDMLFFDDEDRNIRSVSSLGVVCILVEYGMSNKLLQEGLDRFRQSFKSKS